MPYTEETVEPAPQDGRRDKIEANFRRATEYNRITCWDCFHRIGDFCNKVRGSVGRQTVCDYSLPPPIKTS